MKEKQNKSEVLKVRVTLEEKDCIERTAKDNQTSVSKVIRASLFNTSTSSYAISVQHNLIRNKICNQITYLDIPQKYKEQVLQEVSDID